MEFFFNKDTYSVYGIKNLFNKRIMFFLLLVTMVTIITFCLEIYYLINTKGEKKQSDEFLPQVSENKEENNNITQDLLEVEIEEQKKLPQLTEIGKQKLKNIYKTEGKKAYLTFDDGPSNNTKDILDILNEHDIKATFFVLGSQVKYFPETTRRLYDEGHYIANHGYTHRYTDIYKTPEEVLNEFNQCNQIVADTIGEPEYNSHLFRFPGGSTGGKYATIKEQAIQILEQNNILHIDWNSLTGDSEKSDPTEEYLMNNLQKTTNEKDNLVVLMHDAQAKRVTVDFLPKVIEYLSNQGYEFDSFYSIIE